MTDTTDFPALVELANRLEGKDRKTCELALYTLSKQDRRILKLNVAVDEYEKQLVKFSKEYHEAIVRLAKRDVKIAELEAVFETKWDAEQRAIKAWQKKTGKDMTWPDHAKMVEQLLDDLETARTRIAELEAFRRDALKEVAELARECGTLRAALKPFSDEAGVGPMPGQPDDPRHCNMKFLRAAREAYLGVK